MTASLQCYQPNVTRSDRDLCGSSNMKFTYIRIIFVHITEHHQWQQAKITHTKIQFNMLVCTQTQTAGLCSILVCTENRYTVLSVDSLNNIWNVYWLRGSLASKVRTWNNLLQMLLGKSGSLWCLHYHCFATLPKNTSQCTSDVVS